MRYTLYEDPQTHKFALLRVPNQFDEGRLPIPPAEQWFDTREEAVAAVPQLLNREE